MIRAHINIISVMRNACEDNVGQFEIGSVSNLTLGILRVLQDFGLVLSFTHVYHPEEPNIYFIRINTTKTGLRLFRSLVIVSKPKNQVQVDVKALSKINKRFGGSEDLNVLSTDCGVMTSREALERNLGGELLLSSSVGIIPYLKSIGVIVISK